MGLLSRVCDRHGVEVIAYCLMDNHVHLVLQCPRGGLSAALRDLKSSYARYFNGRHGSSGPIYENRFGSKLVVSHRQLRQVVRYVHRNPYAIAADLDLGSYPWCSHAIYLGRKPAPTWMQIEPAKMLFSDYQRAVERPIESDGVKNGRPTSSHRPRSAAESLPSLTDIVVAVAREAQCPLADIRPGRRNGLMGIAVLLAQEAGYSYQEMREPYGYRTIAAPASAVRRTRERCVSDKGVADTVAAVRWRLWPEAA